MLINPYRIGHSLGYQQPPQVSHGRVPVEIMLLLGLMKREREEEDELRGSGRCGKGDVEER